MSYTDNHRDEVCGTEVEIEVKASGGLLRPWFLSRTEIGKSFNDFASSNEWES